MLNQLLCHSGRQGEAIISFFFYESKKYFELKQRLGIVCCVGALAVPCGAENKPSCKLHLQCEATRVRSRETEGAGAGEKLRPSWFSVALRLTTRSWPRNASFMLSFRRKLCGTRVCVWGTRQCSNCSCGAERRSGAGGSVEDGEGEWQLIAVFLFAFRIAMVTSAK